MRRVAIWLPVVFFSFSSCTKINFTEYRKNPGQLRFCNIATWTDSRGEETRTNIFTYDENGNPLAVESNLHGTGNGFHHFTYDAQERLATYEYEFVQTKNYHYTGAGKQADSATVTDALDRIFSEVYSYDEKGRIIKSVLTFVSSPFEEGEVPTETKEYVYLNDDLGSIQLNGIQQNPDVVYSDKPGIYMTNSVWKFVNQNYSRHAVSNVATTNLLGLPLTFKPNDYEFPFLDIIGQGSTVTYQCE